MIALTAPGKRIAAIALTLALILGAAWGVVDRMTRTAQAATWADTESSPPTDFSDDDVTPQAFDPNTNTDDNQADTNGEPRRSTNDLNQLMVLDAIMGNGSIGASTLGELIVLEALFDDASLDTSDVRKLIVLDAISRGDTSSDLGGLIVLESLFGDAADNDTNRVDLEELIMLDVLFGEHGLRTNGSSTWGASSLGELIILDELFNDGDLL
ncbi:hypothetical protein HY632_01920 [Candidatus Uhrbacteria bacterium]|nr:hypothetical protein [Candidatus Uhrbacteria bacterium]